MTLLAMFGVAPPGAPRAAEADMAMEAFVAALRARDRLQVATFLGEGGRLEVLNTLERPYRRWVIDGRRASELDDLLFGDDGLRDYVVMAGRRAWRRKRGLTYVPPYATGDPIQVRWRRERGRLVVDRIALPMA
jgi:hypothetical protein